MVLGDNATWHRAVSHQYQAPDHCGWSHTNCRMSRDKVPGWPLLWLHPHRWVCVVATTTGAVPWPPTMSSHRPKRKSASRIVPCKRLMQNVPHAAPLVPGANAQSQTPRQVSRRASGSSPFTPSRRASHGSCGASAVRPNAANHNTCRLPPNVRSARNQCSHGHAVPPRSARMLQITTLGGCQRVCGARTINSPTDPAVPPRGD